MTVELRDGPFEPYAELQRHQTAMGQEGHYGATSVFVGTMRDFNDGRGVEAMTLEYYPGMTEKHLNRIIDEAGRRWDVIDTLLIHRVGEIAPNQPIVLVAIWSSHRAAAFDACRYVMEELKQRAPFWKRETRGSETRWVETNTKGY